MPTQFRTAAVIRDANGNINESCIDLDRELVWHGANLAVKNEQPFMGKPHTFWMDRLLDVVQPAADAANPEQFEDWGVACYA